MLFTCLVNIGIRVFMAIYIYIYIYIKKFYITLMKEVLQPKKKYKYYKKTM